MNGALDILRRERDESVEQIRVLRSRIRDLDAALSVLEGHSNPARVGRAPGDFKLSVLAKLEEVGAAGATPKEIADAFIQAGRPTSDASVSSTLSRLKGESKVLNRGGRWFAANTGTSSENQHVSQGATDWDDLDDVPF